MLCFFFKQKTAYEMRISDWSSDVCSSDLAPLHLAPAALGFMLGGDVEASAAEAQEAAVGPGDRPAGDAEAALRLALDAEIALQIAEGAPCRERRHQGRAAVGIRRLAQELRNVAARSEEHTSELQSLMRSSSAVFCL